MEFIRDYPWLVAIMVLQIIAFVGKTITMDKKIALMSKTEEATDLKLEKVSLKMDALHDMSLTATSDLKHITNDILEVKELLKDIRKN